MAHVTHVWVSCWTKIAQKLRSWLPKSGVLNGTHGLVEPRPKQTGHATWKPSLLPAVLKPRLRKIWWNLVGRFI